MIEDVTVFDPARVIDRSTIDRPTAPSEGIEMVVVNGRLALDGGRPTGAPFGRALVRSRHEPARVMDDDRDRWLRVDGALSGSVPVEVRLDQRRGAERPAGTMRVTGLPGGPLAIAPGILQTASRWASVTGIGRTPDGGRQVVTLSAEAADPLAAGVASVTLLVDGREALAGALSRGAVMVERGYAPR